MWVNTQLGSAMCFNFFHEVNKITLLLAKKNPRGYCMGGSLADPIFCKIVGSGAKDGINGYLAFLDKLKSLDNTLTFVPHVTNRKRKYENILTTIKDMAVSSKRVPEQSYKWFKLNSQWSDIDMDSKYLYHQGKPFMTKDELNIDQLVFTNDDFKAIVGEIEKNDSSETGGYGYTPSRLDLKRRLVARLLLMHHNYELADSVSTLMSRPNMDPNWSSKVLRAVYKQLLPLP
ncbi:unnamed protein product [Euphydryas editha]|uniref:3-hydroxyisobutyryl-CoA hydrolase n=1 Tax=Euphydryas editha TaxID=104508 RepID=A0AAU9UQJ9_EUPED|nr:unnamed protein product [Euphydryas editha]